ncbi:MAG: flagellar hook-associated protein FlgK [Gammaproteobacteria bacterium]|nr:flagellar hook-associated protein FlgK [Gammaproteobacteria bacterium]
MADLLSTGLSSLLASQRAIATTSHNIANADTEGYSRQRVNLETRPSEYTISGYIGQGVQVSGIERINNQFIQKRLEQATTDQARSDVYYEMISRIDVMLADDNAGLSSVQTEFFNSIQDLNTNPTSVAARQSVLNAAANLADRFNSMQNQLDALQDETNNRINTVINDINTIAENIAELNGSIISAGATAKGEMPNDLLDQRDYQLTELAKLISIDVIEQDDGSVNVVLGKGLSLVSNGDTATLSQITDPSQPEKTQIAVEGSNGPLVIGDQLTGGSLGGLLDFRRETLDQSMNEIGRLAVVLADQFNEQHIQGLTLEGDPGGEFFRVPQPEVTANQNNTGSAAVDVSLTDTTQLTTSDYSLSYDGSEYTLTRLSDNQSVSGAGPLSMDGLQVDISGTANAGDSFLIRPTRKAAREFSFELSNVEEIALSSPIRSEAPVSNLGTGEITSPVITDPEDPNLTDTVEIRFNNPPDTFDVINTSDGSTIAGGVSFTKGEAIEYQGWRVEITGEPASGDTFSIEFNAGSTGDNSNGQLLANLQSDLLIGGTSSLLDGYSAFISQIGSNTRQAGINKDAMDSLLEEAQASRESVSGVNLDEEAINLTRYQQAYQASAQIIAAADNMFQTLLGAIG